MSAEPKMSGKAGKVWPIQRLKDLCKKKPAVADELWTWHEDPEINNSAVRGRIESRWGITLQSDARLSEFWRWLSQRQEQSEANDTLENFEAFTKERNPDKSPEWVRNKALEFFLMLTVQKKDPNKFATVMQLDQNERFGKTKAAFEERKIKVSEQKLQVIVCERFLEWFKDDRAKQIAESSLGNAAKIEALRQTYFKDVEELQKSGKVKLPD